MDTVRRAHVRDDTAVRAWQLVREPFTARTWRRVAYALLAVPVGLVCLLVGLVGGPAGRWQRGLVRRFLGTELSAVPRGVTGSGSPARGLIHAIARSFTVSERAVEKHIASIFTKLGLTPSDTGNRRVLAVLRYLETTG